MGFFEELQKATDIQYILITDYIAQLAKEQDSGIEATVNYLLRSSLKNAYEKQAHGNYALPYYDLDEGSPLFNTLIELKEFFKKQVSIFTIHSIEDELELFNKISIGNLYLKKSELPVIRPTINNVSKAPPPPNHIKTTTAFNQSTSLTVSDLIKSQKQEKIILPNNYQRMTMLYNYFTPHQASCLIAGLHPNFNGSNDDLEIAQGLIKSGLKKGKIKLDDEGEIEAYDLQLYLAKLGWVLEGFNVSLSLEQSTQVTELQKRIDELENKLSQAQEAKSKVAVIPFGKRIDFISKDLPQSERIKKSYELCSDNISFYEDTHPVNTPDEMIKRIQGLLKVIRDKDSKISELEKQTNTPNSAQDKIDELEHQLAQAKAELADNPADEVELNPKTQTAVTRLLNVLFHKARLDITAHKGTTNKNIVNSSISLNAKITEKPVSHWIKQVQQLRIDTEKNN